MSIPFRREDPLPPGAVEEIAPGLRRIVCANPGPFTFRGTNTYLIGRGGDVAVLDPGPEGAAEHHAAILRATEGERITRILVSHTHHDHSRGVPGLVAALGARGIGSVPTHGFGPHMTPASEGGEGGDHDFVPDVRLADGAVLEGSEWRLTALHTPGHCANHLCFALEMDGISGVLFSADHVMAWSTTVVSPPDGDMSAYMESLAKLAARGKADRLYLPGHGPRLPEPHAYVSALAAHRREREAMVLEALRKAGPGTTAEALVPPVYGPELDPRLVRGAARSLLAHLLKLEREGLVARDGPGWAATR